MQGPLRNLNLVGHWAYKGPDGTTKLIISADGTWSGTAAQTRLAEHHFEGNWVVEKDYIYWIYTKSSLPMVKVGTRDKDKLLAIGEDFFELQTRNNRHRKYFRVR